MIKRDPKWTTLLAKFIQERRTMPFKWGTNDCCSFAIKAIEAFTGTLVFPITWNDEDSAIRTIAKVGGLEAACTSIFGAPNNNYRFMRQGDVGLFMNDNMPCIMVCIGHQVCGPTLQGPLGFYPFNQIQMFWKVG